MKKRVKIIILTTIIVLIGITGFGLYAMEIEDHYGELQELFYNSKNGDIIVNKTKSEFGIIEKNWKRINIKTKKKNSTDLYNWIYQKGTEIKGEIYRATSGKVELNGITYSEIQKMIDNKEIELITNN